MSQTDTGLHMRQRARAFIIADADNPSDRVAFVNAGMLLFSSPSAALFIYGALVLGS